MAVTRLGERCVIRRCGSRRRRPRPNRSSCRSALACPRPSGCRHPVAPTSLDPSSTAGSCGSHNCGSRRHRPRSNHSQSRPVRGTFASALVPSPSCPYVFEPQHHSCFARRPHEWEPPAATAVQSAFDPTWIGHQLIGPTPARALAHLAVEVVAPTPQLSAGLDRTRVEGADRHGAPVGVGADLLRQRVIGRCAVTELAEGVVTPTPQRPRARGGGGTDGARVVSTSRDRPPRPGTSRHQGRARPIGRGAVAELTAEVPPPT